MTGAMQKRAAGIQEWLSEHAPYCASDQKHLDEHSVERAYWHYGYLAALRDLIDLEGAGNSARPEA